MLGPKTGSLAEQPTCLWTSVETIVLESFHFFNWCFGLVNHKTLLQVLLVHPRFSNYMRSFVEERRKRRKRKVAKTLAKSCEDDLCGIPWDPMGSLLFISCFPIGLQEILDHERDPGTGRFPPKGHRYSQSVSLIYAIYAHSFYIQSQTGHFRYLFLWLAVFVGCDGSSLEHHT